MNIQTYIKQLINSGIWSFTTNDARKMVDQDLPFALQQLRKAGRIVDPARGFYVIVPEEMSLSNRLPAERFIDDLMRFHQAPYYVGLLTAAFYYGSAHQSPQVFQVITDRPRRSVIVRTTKIQFYTKQNQPPVPISKRNTPTGTMNISTPETTVLDLVKYSRDVGGMDHVANVISEMIEQVKVLPFADAAQAFSTPVLQRIGYIFELLDYQAGVRKVDSLLSNRSVAYTLLESTGPKSRSPKHERWKIIINSSIEIEY